MAPVGPTPPAARSSSAAPAAGRRDGSVPGQIMPPPALPPVALIPPGAGGRFGGLGGLSGFSLRISQAPVDRRVLRITSPESFVAVFILFSVSGNRASPDPGSSW